MTLSRETAPGIEAGVTAAAPAAERTAAATAEFAAAGQTVPEGLTTILADRIRESIAVKQRLAADLEVVARVGQVLIEAFSRGNKLVLFGNGGSAADSQHIAAEFVGRFYILRRALPAMALTVNTSVLTAVGNDFGFRELFQRQVEALGREGDVAMGLSTSGDSENVVLGLRAARAAGMTTVGLTGQTRARIAQEADLCVAVPSTDTPRIQESHILLGHIWSEIVEQALFGTPGW